MKYILIPCYSNAPDRDHDCVVLGVDDELLETLAANKRAFDMRKLTDPKLYAHEYRGGPLHYLHLDEDDLCPEGYGYGSYLDSPGEPVGLTEHLNTPLLHGPWHLESATAVYLKVVEEGFLYTWDGRYEKYGPSEVYETHTFTLEELEALYRPTPLR
jgi:hypothetical protein